MTPIYLDHNASTPVAPAVLEEMLPWLTGSGANPSADHAPGRRARHAIERARAQVSQLLDCTPEQVVFTSGGTESNNMAILGSARAAPADRRQIVTTAVEHPAVLRPCAALQKEGFRIDRAAVGSDGTIDVDAVRAMMGPQTALVTAMLANNETGALLPVGPLAEAAHDCGAWVHTDAAQAVGKVPVSVRTLGVDLLTVAGHKLYAPKGVGALVVGDIPLAPILFGATHERGLRPGTANVPAIVGLGAACVLAGQGLAEEAERQNQLRELLWRTLSATIPRLRRTVAGPGSLPNTLHVMAPGLSGTAILVGAPEVAASTGSACHSGRETPSAVLVQMGITPELALGALRLSLGRTTTAEDVAHAAAHIARAANALRP